MGRLNIYDPRERALVTAADAALWPIAAARRALRSASAAAPRRILCLRLERIGDLLMTVPALMHLRTLAPEATIDLVVGSWNHELAAAIPAVDRVEVLDAAWLARGAGGRGPAALLSAARRWRARGYDLAFNFEPDIRSNLALAVSGARRVAGFASGGGGALLDVALDYDVRAHTADNALRLVHYALGSGPGDQNQTMGSDPGLRLPTAAIAAAAARLAALPPGPRLGMHVSGGRAVKQWPEARFADLAARLVADRQAVIVLTGAPADRAQVDVVKQAVPPERVLDVAGQMDLVALAALLAQLELFVTGDTGPMHLAHAVGTPVVGIFGPSDPVRYAPRGARDRIVRIDLPCSPCNRIRRPPARCTGHTPDCLAGIDVARVLHAIDEALGP